MKFLNDVQKLGSVEYGLLGVEEADHANGIEKLYSVDEFSEEVDVFVVFVGSDEFHDEGGGN